MQEKLDALVRTQAMQLFRHRAAFHHAAGGRAAAYQQKNHLHRLPLQGGPSAGHGRPCLCGHPPLQAGNSGRQRYFAGKAAGRSSLPCRRNMLRWTAADEGAGREIPGGGGAGAQSIGNGWEPTMALLEQAVAEGVMRPVSLPVLRQMITASIESFLADRSLAESGVQYVAVLEEMISILLEGVLPR